MKFRRAAPATIIASTIVVILVSAIISNRMFSGMTSSVEASQFDRMQRIVEFNLKGAASKAMARAELLADLPETRRLLAAKDAAGLVAEFGEMFQAQRDKHGLDKLQFLVPPATILVRIHHPDAPPEDVSSFRPMIVKVDADHLARSGPSLGRSGPAISAVVPIHDAANTHLGMVEVGVEIGEVLDNLKTAYDYDLAFYVLEDKLREVATSAPPEMFDEKNRVGRYLRIHATNDALLAALVDSNDASNVEEPRRMVHDAMGSPYGVVLIPVTDAGNNPLAIVAVARDFNSTRGAAGRSMVWQGLIALFGIVVLTGVTLLVIRGFLLAPLRAIVQGKPLDGDPLCEELQEASRAFADLRAQAAPPEAEAEASDGGGS